jgi:hypothetical protein
MVFPVPGAGTEIGGPAGYTYAAVVVRIGDGPRTRQDVLGALREMRFSGWLAQPENGWLPAVAAPGEGTVAAGRRGVVGVGASLAERLGVTVVAIRVLADRQLALAMWADGDEVGRYVSDPSREPGADEDVLSDPLGDENAAAFAEVCGRTEAADDLAEVLGEELDPESVIESERLARVLRLLRLPTWLVAAATLPRAIPTGPGGRDLTRLGAGVPGLLGVVCGRAVNVVRRRRPPPPLLTDVPRGSSGMDPWLY